MLDGCSLYARGFVMRRNGLPLLEGEGWGEVLSISGKATHLTLSLSFQERGPVLPATCVTIAACKERDRSPSRPSTQQGGFR
ncbi:hypothetical protein ASF26_21360 [Methylobacterium sp. Leaf93]|nr:hypothetical protein ASF26_21360 [Methylobacterium sp. Leaf93]